MKNIFSVLIFILFPITIFSYEYSVSGYGSDGDYVYGDVETSGQDVDGYLYDYSGNTIYFDGEFDGYGTIEGYGDDGIYYELEVN